MKPTELQKAAFIISCAKSKQFPADLGSEVAFAGRSNSGKSSAINTICHQKNLAKKSKTPGRTQLLNFFTVEDQARLVDLPGYGFAQVSANVQKNWEQLIEEYFEKRQSLRGIVLMMDSRHPLRDLDEDFIHPAIDNGIPILILLSKADKLSRNQQNQVCFKVRTALKQFEDMIRVELFSSLKPIGHEIAREQIAAWLS